MSSGFTGVEPHSLHKDVSSLEDASQLMCARYNDDISAQEVGELYAAVRIGGVSLRQVVATISKVCGKDGVAKNSQMSSIFLELDRRYFIVENARWEFSMLDGYREGRISERNAKNLFKTVQGSQFSGGWSLFQKKRSNPGSTVTWEEIEVPLCEIVLDNDLEDDSNAQVNVSRESPATEIQMIQSRDNTDSQGTDTQQELLVSSEEKISKAVEREQTAMKHSREAEQKLGAAQNEQEKGAAGESQRLASQTLRDENFVLREKLQKAVKSEKLKELVPAVAAVRQENVPNCSELITEAEELIKKLQVAGLLKEAVAARKIAELEGALSAVKRGGWEKALVSIVAQANTLLEKLHRLEQRKRAILELSQRVIAELKSYSQPPALVHQVMIATFLLLGSSEKETKSWQGTQILIGKTGKTSLKRRVSECNASTIPGPVAQKVATILSRYEFPNVQDTSLGCAAFYSWAEGIVEEVQACDS